MARLFGGRWLEVLTDGLRAYQRHQLGLVRPGGGPVLQQNLVPYLVLLVFVYLVVKHTLFVLWLLATPVLVVLGLYFFARFARNFSRFLPPTLGGRPVNKDPFESQRFLLNRELKRAMRTSRKDQFSWPVQVAVVQSVMKVVGKIFGRSFARVNSAFAEAALRVESCDLAVKHLGDNIECLMPHSSTSVTSNGVTHIEMAFRATGSKASGIVLARIDNDSGQSSTVFSSLELELAQPPYRVDLLDAQWGGRPGGGRAEAEQQGPIIDVDYRVKK